MGGKLCERSTQAQTKGRGIGSALLRALEPGDSSMPRPARRQSGMGASTGMDLDMLPRSSASVAKHSVQKMHPDKFKSHFSPSPTGMMMPSHTTTKRRDSLNPAARRVTPDGRRTIKTLAMDEQPRPGVDHGSEVTGKRRYGWDQGCPDEIKPRRVASQSPCRVATNMSLSTMMPVPNQERPRPSPALLDSEPRDRKSYVYKRRPNFGRQSVSNDVLQMQVPTAGRKPYDPFDNHHVKRIEAPRGRERPHGMAQVFQPKSEAPRETYRRSLTPDRRTYDLLAFDPAQRPLDSFSSRLGRPATVRNTSSPSPARGRANICSSSNILAW
jgi:hypothetical protein